MKRLNYLVNGLAALALIVLFSKCAGKADNQTTNASAQAAGLSGMKIAYVEIDTLYRRIEKIKRLVQNITTVSI